MVSSWVAETLTRCSTTRRLGDVTHSYRWFIGGVTAYTAETQVKAAGMALGPVVTETARDTSWLSGAAVRVAATGVDCPEPIDCRLSLTGLAAVWDRIKARVEEKTLPGCSNELLCDHCVCFETSPSTLVVRPPLSFDGPKE